MSDGFHRGFFLRLFIWLFQRSRVTFYRFLSSNSIVGNPRRLQPIHCTGLGRIFFEKNVQVGVYPSPFFFSTYASLDARSRDAEIYIKEGTAINNNFRAISTVNTIVIGRRCLIGSNVEIVDSDFHSLRVEDRGDRSKVVSDKVIVGGDVFIGSNVTILKGAVLGDKCVICNGSVVTGVVPEGAIAGGVPARVIRMVD